MSPSGRPLHLTFAAEIIGADLTKRRIMHWCGRWKTPWRPTRSPWCVAQTFPTTSDKYKRDVRRTTINEYGPEISADEAA